MIIYKLDGKWPLFEKSKDETGNDVFIPAAPIYHSSPISFPITLKHEALTFDQVLTYCLTERQRYKEIYGVIASEHFDHLYSKLILTVYPEEV